MTGNVWSATAAGTDSGASATQAAPVAGHRHVCTHISGHTDADALITIESPASTVIWESKIDISLEGTTFSFPVGGVVGAQDGAIVGKVASSTANCQVNISGYQV